MRVVLVPSVIEIHGRSTVQPFRFSAALAIITTSFDGRKFVGHGLESAPAAPAQRITDSANRLFERTIAIRTCTLLSGVYITVLIVVSVTIRMEIDLCCCYIASVSFLAVLHQCHEESRTSPFAMSVQCSYHCVDA